MVYSPGAKKVFPSFGQCLVIHLSCSLYSKAEVQNSLLWDSSCHCIYLPTRYALGPEFSTFQTQLVTSPYSLVPFSHTDCPSSQVCSSALDGERQFSVLGKVLCFSLIEDVGNIAPGLLSVGT